MKTFAICQYSTEFFKLAILYPPTLNSLIINNKINATFMPSINYCYILVVLPEGLCGLLPVLCYLLIKYFTTWVMGCSQHVLHLFNDHMFYYMSHGMLATCTSFVSGHMLYYMSHEMLATCTSFVTNECRES